jgi:hypothetical protein
VAGVRTVTPDSTGLVEFTNVRPNSGSSGDQISSPTGTAYQLVTKFPNGATITEYIDVTDAAGPLYVQDILTAAPSAVTSLSGTYVAKAGDTMTGALNVTNASSDNHALNRITADGRYLTPAAGDAAYVSLSGDTMTGALVVDEANVTVRQPAVATGLEGFYVVDDADTPIYGVLGGGLLLGGASLLTSDGTTITTNGQPLTVGPPLTSADALSEDNADTYYIRKDGIDATVAADPTSGEVAIYSQSLAGSTLMIVDDHGHRTPVGWDAHHLMQYTRVSPTNGSGGDAAAVGARWDSLTDTDCLNPTAGFPPAWGFTITGANTTAGINTNVALFRRGSAGTLGDGWKASFTFWTPDTLTTWTTPGATEGTRLFVGMSSENPSTIVGSDDPTGHRAGLSFVNVNGARGDTTLFISTKDGNTETLTDTSIVLAASTVYEVILQQVPGGDLKWQVRNLTADPDREQTVASTPSLLNFGAISANLPTAYLKAAAALRAVGAPDKSVWLNHLTITA